MLDTTVPGDRKKWVLLPPRIWLWSLGLITVIMLKLAILSTVLSMSSVVWGQLPVKPQAPVPEPLIREAFIPKGSDVLLSYPMEAGLNGKTIWLWKYHNRKLADLSVSNALGKELKKEEVLEALKKPSIILLSRDGKPVHPYYLKVIKPETLVIIDKTPGAEPAQKQKLGR